jgi:hypothetical protein
MQELIPAKPLQVFVLFALEEKFPHSFASSKSSTKPELSVKDFLCQLITHLLSLMMTRTAWNP